MSDMSDVNPGPGPQDGAAAEHEMIAIAAV